MANRYNTITRKRMWQLSQLTGRFRFQGCDHGDIRRYTRTDGRRMVHFYWHELEDLPRSITIHDRYNIRSYKLAWEPTGSNKGGTR